MNENELRSLSGGSYAGNNMQLSILHSLKKIEETDINAISILSIAAFPKDKVVINKRKIKIIESIKTVQISFFNFPVFKQLNQALNMYSETRKKLIKGDFDIVLSYNLYPQVGYSIFKLNKKNIIPTVSILADLPIDDNESQRNILSKLIMNRFNSVTKKYIGKCDNYIILNKNVVEEYKLHDKNVIVIDGGIGNNKIPTESISYNNKSKIVLYTGALTEYSGIMNLINAMKYFEDNTIVLKIYGSGPLEEQVKAESTSLVNVEFCGYASNSEIMEEQKNAYILVNPRVTDDPISLVTFPSKIFEYMTSGTVVLSTRLNGFDENYDKLIYFSKSNSPFDLYECMEHIFKSSINELQVVADNAKAYVLNNKTWDKQTKKIYEFIAEIITQKDEK